jgi:preprotein translocase subunit YajC
LAPTATDAEPGATVTVVTTGGGGAIATVDAATTFEVAPNTAFAFRVPRNAIT